MRDLRRQGVSLRKIRNCVAKLRQIMPGLKQPLSEVRISLVADQLILGKNRRRFTPEGQLFIDFNVGESAPVTPAREAFDELFFQALEDEDAGRLSEAREKYEQVLAAVPDHVDALVNLGTILFLAGDETAAASRYLQALAINPDHVEGNYNLANLLEGQGELDAAVLFYKKAIQAGPGVCRRPLQPGHGPGGPGELTGGPGPLAALPGTGPRQQVGRLSSGGGWRKGRGT